jgi:hypothetical protein
VAPEAQMAYNIASLAARRLTTKLLVHCSLVATEHSMSSLADRLVPMVAYTMAHCSSVAMGHSTSVVTDRLVPMVAYTLAPMAARRLTPKPLAYHWPIATGHSIPAAVALADLEAYTLASAMQEQTQNSLRFAALQKEFGMWMYHIWHRMIGRALTRNYNLGSTLFVVLEGAHSQSRKYHLVRAVYYTVHSAIAMMSCKAMGQAIPVVS